MRSERNIKSGGDLGEKEPQILVAPGLGLRTESFREDKDWWAPVWKGLVMDERAAHFQKMGNAIWLFIYFLLNANRKTGILLRKVKTISADTGIHRRRIFEWLTILRDEGYITTKSSGRCLEVVILKWKPLREVRKTALQEGAYSGEVRESAPQKCGIPHSRSAKSRTSQTHFETPKPAWLKEKLAAWSVPKKNTIKENILKSDIAVKNFDFKNFDPMTFKTREELLAYDLAKALGDFPGYPLYLTLARKHPESLLRETLGRVKEISGAEIKTSRGALFNFLIQRHALKSSLNPRR